MFDGHGGLDAAIYAANHLHVNLVRQEMFNQDPIEALCHAFKVTDERFVQKASREVSYYPINRGKELTQATPLFVDFYFGSLSPCVAFDQCTIQTVQFYTDFS